MSIFDHSRDFLKKHYVEVEKLRRAVWEELEKVEDELELWGELKPEECTVLAQAEYDGRVLKVTVDDYLPRKGLNAGELRSAWAYPVAQAIRDLASKTGKEIKFHRAFCAINIYLPKNTAWDPDNRAFPHIINGLRFARVIEGDTWDKLTFMVAGNVDKNRPRTEVFVTEQDYILPSLRDVLLIKEEKFSRMG